MIRVLVVADSVVVRRLIVDFLRRPFVTSIAFTNTRLKMCSERISSHTPIGCEIAT